MNTVTIGTIPIEKIGPSKTNPRTNFNDDAMKELIESIKKKGIIYPLTVRRTGGNNNDPTYEIVDGERRYRAAKKCRSTSGSWMMMKPGRLR